MKLIWKETIQSLKQNMSLSFSSFILIQFITLLLAISFIAFNVTSQTIHSFKNETQIHVQLNDSVNGEDIEVLKNTLEKEYDISIIYSSKEKEFKKLQRFYGDEDFFDIYKNDNPLKNAFLVTTKNIENIQKIASSIKERNEIYDVQYGGTSLVNTIRNLNTVQLSIGGIFIFLSILISIILYNITKLTVLARSENIRIKEGLGAHPRSIRTPFILESILFYLISIIIPFVASLVIYTIVVNNEYLLFVESESMWTMGLKLFIFLFSYALIFGFANSYISVKRILSKIKKVS